MRIKEFQKIIKAKSCGFAMFYNLDSDTYNPNMYYFSSYSGLGVLIVPANNPPFLIVPKMELERAKKSAIKSVYSMDKKRFLQSVHEILSKKKIKIKNIAIDNAHYTLNFYKYLKKQFKKAKAKDISLACLRLREIKNKKEVKILQKSCYYADKIIQKTIKKIKSFKTESEVAAYLEYETKKLGLDISFPPIVASGINGSMPHHIPKNVKIKKGFCVIDFGVKYKGYCSDMTRTIYLGKPTKKEKEIYNLLLKIQKDTINLSKKEKKCSELYDFAVKSLGKYKNHFTHGLGHGVGAQIHEFPNLTTKSNDKIQNNAVYTVEPGVYFPNKFGIRIEDTILFKDKPIILTKTSKDLKII